MKKKKPELLEFRAADEAMFSRLPADFFKQFKTVQDINGFMDKLFKRGVKKKLESEISEHLGYDKHAIEGNGSGNSRNGKSRKLVKSSSGEITIEVPSDRQGDFTLIVLPKRQKVIDKIVSVVISLYARGISTRDIEIQIKDISDGA